MEDEAIIKQGIALFLYSNSGSIELEEPPNEAGEPTRGRELVTSIGCLGCHIVPGEINGRTPDTDWGPNLSKVGSKTNHKWIYNWIRDPKKLWPDATMPKLPLEPEDANNIQGSVLILHGAEDQTATLEEVNKLIADLRAAEIDWQLELYSGAEHGFTNPGSPSEERADREYKAASERFFAEIFAD